ncbi:MAG: PD40 domain-containing protein, partial [Planctomycetaceae bacterium]|nr:PD40 domain-containing protein [Planctomycetaceae bacterium]
DIYALGAIFYECVTGRPPFRAATSAETIFQVIHHDPVPLRQLQPDVPRDLETICLKCLEKEPEKRYASAEDLAEELHRFFQGLPIHARPIGPWGRGIRWVLRFPVVSALLLTLLMSILTGAGFSAWYAIRADQNAKQAENNAETADINASIAKANARKAQEEAERAKIEEQLAIEHRDKAESIAYSRNLFASRQAWMMGNRTEAWHLLDQSQKDLREWEFYYLRTQLLKEPVFSGHVERVDHLAFSPDNRLLVSASMGDVRLWDLASQKMKAMIRIPGHLFELAFSPDGSKLALLDTNELALYNTETGEKDRTIKDNWVRNTAQQLVAWSPDGKLIAAAADQSLQIWDAKTGERVDQFPAPTFCRHLMFSPDTRQILVVAIDGAMTLWDLETKKQNPLPTLKDSPDARPVFQHGNLYCWRP